ncbi:MAG TPA: class I SAM-dependent methyltransferase [Bacteroidales bacterium]|jgi:hypothetical protein|nr:class I SAM-dependent methyltransferase [Bacteroidales bacterium]HQB36655.1 class I SAM-dependent methyltransferase [Bacteroidales bacterium]
MKSLSYIKGLLVITFLTFSLSLLHSQDNSDNTYVPQVGQRGKDVVWVPTPQELVDTMLSIAKVTPKDVLIDLGSGDGRTVISAAKIGAQATGVEFNPDMVALSRRNAEQAGVGSRAQFIEGDLFQADLSKATVITMFLLPEINLRLRPKLLDLKPGTRIVSNTFTMGEWEPDIEVNTVDNWNSWNTALLWIIPAKVEGTWRIGNDELSLSQDFQFVRGTFTSNGQTTAVSDGRLNGNEIVFTLGTTKYQARVDGNNMTGTASNASNKWNWKAVRK